MTLGTLARSATRQAKDVAEETSRRAGSVATRLSKRDILALIAIAAGGFSLYQEIKDRRQTDEPEW